ncbi:hypothetical protein CTEN210_06679 [Chaetoceros tenuissimus]|uniref:THH1/TOM1/TOM3 domain-containing protein n=1 Tax=Chaetoceros tenuissimus TaxID=426638 RepID=A0AAD3CQU9_9STRA|nr:hypothetical protein CTEN210_06679 [Chaetoceros tenuissimus]
MEPELKDYDDPKVQITLSLMDMTLLISSMLYLFCLNLARKRLKALQEINPTFGLKKLLVLSVSVISALRIMTFLGVTCMDVANVRAHYSPSPSSFISSLVATDHYQNFYDASMAVLFDLPNTIAVSTYVLLTLVWAECLVQSRIHTVDNYKLKQKFLLGFTIFNSCLYSAQLILYTVLIFDPQSTEDETVKNFLYAAMTCINAIALILVGFIYIALNLYFSGFPFRSARHEKGFRKICKVLAMWTASRLSWAIVMLVVYIKGIDLLHYSSLLMAFLFIVCEILPIVAMLDYSYLHMVGLERNENIGNANLVQEEFDRDDRLDAGHNDQNDWLGLFNEDEEDNESSPETNALNEPLL